MSNSKNRVRTAAIRQVQSLQGLQKRQKIILIAAIVLLFLFSQSVIQLGQKQQGQTNDVAYQDQIKQINDKKNSIEANLLVQNHTTALQLIQEADTLLANLPRSSKQRQKTYEDLLSSFAPLRDRAYRKTVIQDPQVLIATSALLSSGNFFDLEILNDKIALLSVSGIATIDKDGKNAQFLGAQKPLPKYSASAMLGKNMLYIGDSKIYQLNDKYEVTTQKITLPEGDIRGLATYENNFYALAGNQVYKWRVTNGDYSAGSGWVSGDRSIIEQVRSVSVDGSLYALLPNAIKKYVKGVEQQFTLEEVSPAMHDATYLYTNTELSNIYVLEPQEKRLLVFAKNGKLVQQYTSDKFQDAVSVKILEKEGFAYVLTKTNLLTFTLNQ